jgi:hypothetical protein
VGGCAVQRTLCGQVLTLTASGSVEAQRRLARNGDRPEIDTRRERFGSQNEQKLDGGYAANPKVASTPVELGTSRARDWASPCESRRRGGVSPHKSKSERMRESA